MYPHNTWMLTLTTLSSIPVIVLRNFILWIYALWVLCYAIWKAQRLLREKFFKNSIFFWKQIRPLGQDTTDVTNKKNITFWIKTRSLISKNSATLHKYTLDMTSTSLPKWWRRRAYRSSMEDFRLGIPSFSNLKHIKMNHWFNELNSVLSILFSEKKFVSDVQIIYFSVERRVVVLISDESFLSEEDPGILSEGVILKAGCFGVKSRFTVSNEYFLLPLLLFFFWR